MTLKYNQGHWKWYWWVKLNDYIYNHHAKFDIYHIYHVRESCNIEVFAVFRHLAIQSNIDPYIYSHFSCGSKIRKSKQMGLAKTANTWREPLAHNKGVFFQFLHGSILTLQFYHPRHWISSCHLQKIMMPWCWMCDQQTSWVLKQFTETDLWNINMTVYKFNVC